MFPPWSLISRRNPNVGTVPSCKAVALLAWLRIYRLIKWYHAAKGARAVTLMFELQQS